MIYFWIIALVLFIASLIFKSFYSKRLVSQVGNDELLPRVKEMLAGKVTRQNILETKNKLLAEGIEAKRISRLISASVYSKSKFPIWLSVLLIIIVAVNIFRAYSSSSTPAHPTIVTSSSQSVYKNSEQGYEITLSPNWVGAVEPNTTNKVYFVNSKPSYQNTLPYPVTIEVLSAKTKKDIASSSVQQSIVSSLYSQIQAGTTTSQVISVNTTSQPPYIEYIGVSREGVSFHMLQENFFGNGNEYALLITAPDSIWMQVKPDLMQVASTFKVE